MHSSAGPTVVFDAGGASACGLNLMLRLYLHA